MNTENGPLTNYNLKVNALKIIRMKLSDYEKMRSNHNGKQILSVPQNLQTLFGWPPLVTAHCDNLLVRSIPTLTPEMCTYLHVSESLAGLSGNQMLQLISEFRYFSNSLFSFGQVPSLDLGTNRREYIN